MKKPHSEKEHIPFIRVQEEKYLWTHEINLYANPLILFLMWKIFFFIWLGLALFILALSLSGSGGLDNFPSMARALLGVLIFLLVLVSFAYYLYALMQGGRYSVLFEMDPKGVRHTQLNASFQKAQKMGLLTMTLGLLSKKPGIAGAGLLAATHASLYTEFKKVKSIKIDAKRHVIRLRSSDFTHNQVYTAPEDFDFILAFIQKYIPPSL